MRKLRLLSTALVLMCLVSCDRLHFSNGKSSSSITSSQTTTSSSSDSFSSEPSSSSDSSSSQSSASSSSSSSSATSSSSSSGSASSSSSASSSASSSSTQSSSSSSSIPQSGTTKIEVYAVNDFHGHVIEEGSNIGLPKLMSYLKARGDEPNTLLLDQGDTWQETLYSAYNQGHLITDVMNYVQFDARTIGNHDFDWGVKVLQDNTERDYNGYSTPVLGANIFEYDNDLKTITSRQCSELGTTSVTYTLENGLKVGIVGVIGEDQYTSISSNIVKDVAFKDHISVIKSEATKLRENGCDVVICSAHTGQDSLTGNNLSNYVDLVLCGHTHRDEHTTEGNLFYGQYGCDGQKFGHVTLTYDYGQKKVVSTSSDTLDRYDISTSIDPQIQAICDPYFAEVQEVASIKYLKNKTQYFSRSAMARLMCEAMYEQAVVEGYDVYGAMCNEARDYISANRQWTYEDIFDCFPFNNEVLIMDVKGDELQNELAWNPLYRAPAHISDPVPLDTGSTRIAVIDYVGYHQNTARSYNYFPYGALHVVGTLSVNYRDCLINYLLRHNYDTGGTLDASRYADGTSASEFSTSLNYI